MIGKCPNCQIELNTPLDSDSNNNRITSELLLTLSYRKAIESGNFFKPIEDLGYCELCNARLKDLELQKIKINN